MDAKSVIREVLPDIIPTSKEKRHEEGIRDEVLTILRAVSHPIEPRAEPLLAGSIAKGTDLRGDKDFDLFVLFPRDIPRQEMEEKGLLIGRRFFEILGSKPELAYAEHPYTRGKYKKFTVEIVPCYRIKKGERIISAVDRTPLHTEFVLSALEKKPALRNDIRLLKRFMKVGNLYGANAAVEGFSGYLCELLVIKYGSFLDVLRAASSWKRHECLSLKKPRRTSLDPTSAPLTFIDPVDPNRNAAAAVSMEKLAMFVHLSNLFLRNPDKSFFYEAKKVPMRVQEFYRNLRKRGTEIICVYSKAPRLLEDTLVPQISKSLRALSSECERAGFRVLKKAYWTDGEHIAFLLEFEVWELPQVMKKQGPFFDSNPADIDGFFLANRSRAVSPPYIEGDRWVIDTIREVRHVDDLIREYLANPQGFGKNLRGLKFHTLVGAQLRKIKTQDFWAFMSEFW